VVPFSKSSIWPALTCAVVIAKLKKAAMQGMNYKDYFQAGKSVINIHEIISVEEIIEQITSVET
jgi:hypothetical protein